MDAKALPPPFFSGGESSARSWENGRREEILRLFEHEVYGVTPSAGEYETRCEILSEKEALGGSALRRKAEAVVTARYGTYRIPFVLYQPKGAGEKVPVFLFLSIWGRGELDETGETEKECWPLRTILKRGYGAALLFHTDVDTDCDDGFRNGIVRIFERDLTRRPADGMAAIGEWAFGLSRVMDCLCGMDGVAADRVYAAGHSRGGKTALWAAAQDVRFCGAVSNESGSTGAALSRMKRGERVADINGSFPYWMCLNYRKYNGREELLPVDQHMLLGLIAPRRLYVASASGDGWSDPSAELASLREAAKLYRLYGESVSLPETLPPVGTAVSGRLIGYHLRKGVHDLTRCDWDRFLDFADAGDRPARR